MKYVVLLICSAFLSLQVSAQQPTEPADTILHSGTIVTVDEAFMKAEAVAIRDGRFAAVGTAVDVMALEGPDTVIVDLQGRTVLPGLIDSHVHQFDAAMNRVNVDLFEAKSIRDILERISARVDDVEPGEWVVASSRWHESLIEEGRLPTRFELDSVAPNNPVVIPRGGHVMSVNTLALKAAGYDEDSDSPDGGVVVRNEEGDVTGVLFESAIYPVRQAMPDRALVPPEELRRRVREAMNFHNSFGITGVVEPGLSDMEIGVYRQLDDLGEMTVRTHMLFGAARDGSTDHALRTYARDDFDSDMLRFDGVKYLRDGGVEGGALYQPYQLVEGEQTDPDYRGKLLIPEGFDQWVEDLKRVAAAGWQVQAHGVGDRAIDKIVEAFSLVDMDPRYDVGQLRWAVMHIFLPTDFALRRMADLNILATAQNHPVLLGHNMRRYFGKERADYAIPMRDLIEHGILVGGGTDEPVVPIDPFLSLWWMTTRGTLNGYEMGPEQSISIREALRSYTINNAYIMGREEELGSIEVGKLADLIIISEPILDIPVHEIRDIQALMTMIGGEIVYQSDRL